MIKIGDRVETSSSMFSGAGSVVFIDNVNLYNEECLPIQVELDEPDEDGHKMKRFTLKEVTKI
jgi:hypothetical protein